jgi:hypothetical protein
MPRVPLAPAERVGEDPVRLLDGEEPVGVTVRRVGVIALGESPVRCLDLGGGRAAGYAEETVRIGDARHQPVMA